jgi:hypothetical protein
LDRVALQPTLELAQGEFTLQSMAFFAVANFAVKRGQKVEGDVCGLKIFALGLRNVVDE